MTIKRLSLVVLFGYFLLSIPGSYAKETTDELRKAIPLTVQLNDDIQFSLIDKDHLKVVSLNMAHGRKDAFNQMLVSKETIEKNLDDIAAMLRKEKADVVALQEADAPSWWSGDFNHVEYLAKKAGYHFFIQAAHVDKFFGTYGTAIMSRLPIREAFAVSFHPTPPSTQKGFVTGKVGWDCRPEDKECLEIDIYSVHLDFLRHAKRNEQIRMLGLMLEKRQRKSVIMGDFNSEWLSSEKVIKFLTESGRYKLFEPHSEQYDTYDDKRLDWVIISRDLNFISYKVSKELLSDHQAVIAEIGF
ncbi:endonuclease/exonuclease/phosphatase family protein [Thalassotalea mangrovi]|uniref:Endonuclease/exonuclease/phosphatase domain-containing protein n=1 Tax=Thalassotalea mangrovi TaxID=2572245 RepID=A0A4U1B2D8_9GAMM|nr:endonuclease/exonuclease/phosphatase family protein [Thalassotalea mangrovi]TKB43345.1 hypothetical protein E8M12_15230 [Thalassotalea mangrovi]